MSDFVLIQLRDALITSLKAANTAAGQNVIKQSDEAQDDSQCPYIMVVLGDDDAETDSINGSSSLTVPAILESLTANIDIYCVVKQVDDAEKAAYNLRSEVEAALLGTYTGKSQGGKVSRMIRRGGSPTQDLSTDREVFMVRVRFQMEIMHLESQPTSFAY